MIFVFGVMLALRKNVDSEITISEPEWQCNYLKYSWECDVRFTLKNLTHKHFYGSIGVRGINRRTTRNNTNNELSEITYIPFFLQEYEKKDFQGKILTKAEPKRINLSIIEKKI